MDNIEFWVMCCTITFYKSTFEKYLAYFVETILYLPFGLTCLIMKKAFSVTVTISHDSWISLDDISYQTCLFVIQKYVRLPSNY